MLLVILSLLFIFQYISSQSPSNEEINYYVELITEAEENALTYKLPTNAEQYNVDHQQLKNFGNYDFVIIGAGATGSVVANRLSERENWNILLLEAGDFGNNLTDVPNMYFEVGFTPYNWGYHTTPQKTACLGLEDESCPYPRGRGVGGTTLINGLVYSRGHKSDYDNWAKLLGNPSWSYENVLPYFKKSENYVHRDPDAPVNRSYHGEGGYLNVEYHLPRSPQLNTFLEANKEIGYNIVDYNANLIGASPAQINTKNGRRFDDGKAFVTPVVDRKNLKVLTESFAVKINICSKSKTAQGVEFSHKGEKYYVKANKEVILSAGAFGSPQLLILSGIGPKLHLNSLGIPVIEDLEVGSKLRDNPTFYGINFGSNYTEPIKPLKNYVKEFLEGTGPLAVPGGNQGVGFYPSSYTKALGIPDIEFMIVPANATSSLSQKSFRMTNQTYEDVWGKTIRSQTFIIYIAALHTESVGTVRLKSSNPYDYPLINLVALSDPNGKDIATLYEGVELVLKLLKTKAFKKIDAKLQGGPLRACEQHKYLSKDYWYCAIRQVTWHLNHPLGSCPMGPDPEKGGVVDANLKVYGIEKLRVADASVIPFTLSGHTNAPCVMIGEKLGDILKSDYNI